jgi:hypothetical protein
MKKSRFTEEQIAYALRLAESGTTVAVGRGRVCRTASVNVRCYGDELGELHAAWLRRGSVKHLIGRLFGAAAGQVLRHSAS